MSRRQFHGQACENPIDLSAPADFWYIRLITPRDTDVTVMGFFPLRLALLAAAIVLAPADLSFSAVAEDCLVIDDFSSYSLNTFPSGWTAREDAGKKVYTILKEDESEFVRAKAAGPRSAGNGIEAD